MDATPNENKIISAATKSTQSLCHASYIASCLLFYGLIINV